MSDDKKVDEHFEKKHKGSEDAEKVHCRLCKAYVEGLSAAPAEDLGVNIALKIPLVDVFGKTD